MAVHAFDVSDNRQINSRIYACTPLAGTFQPHPSMYAIWVVLCSTQAICARNLWSRYLLLAEIPVLQLMGALYMGNKVVFKTDSKVRAGRAERTAAPTERLSADETLVRHGWFARASSTQRQRTRPICVESSVQQTHTYVRTWPEERMHLEPR